MKLTDKEILSIIVSYYVEDLNADYVMRIINNNNIKLFRDLVNIMLNMV